MIIRKLEPGEGAIFGQIRVEALLTNPESFAAKATDYDQFSDKDWEAVLASRTAFVAFDAKRPVALASIVGSGLSRMAHRAEVSNVFVSPDFRGTGLSARLWDAVEDYARSQGIQQLELAVNAENRAALRFYERRGYRRIGTIPHGFQYGGRYFDEHLLVRQISPLADPS